MAVRTAFLASGIALAVLAQVPGFCLAVVPKGGTSGALALGFRRDATRFGALPGVGTMSTGRKVKFPNLLELRGAVGGHQGGVNGHGMTSPLIDEAEIPKTSVIPNALGVNIGVKSSSIPQPGEPRRISWVGTLHRLAACTC